MSNKRLDIVIFGATGFTGKYVMLKLVSLIQHAGNVKWGTAGRNKHKMDDVLKVIGEKSGEDLKGIPKFIASCDDEESLINMASQAHIIVNCVGPYILYGEPVVKACIASGTHYIDVTSEPYFIEKMKLKYHEEANNRGVFVIPACGFESVLADSGALFLAKHFKGELNSVECYRDIYYRREGNGFRRVPTMNHTSLHTIQCSLLASKKLRKLQQERSKNTPKLLPTLKQRPFIHKSNILNKWCLPYFGSDLTVMNHTQQYLHEEQSTYRPVQVKCYAARQSFIQILIFIALGAFIFLISSTKCTRRLSRKYPKLFTFGIFRYGVPDDFDQSLTFSYMLHGKGWKKKVVESAQEHVKPLDKEMIVKVSGTTAHGTTGTVAVLSAITILKERNKISSRGGVLSPGAVFYNTSLMEKMDKHGIKFEIISEKEM